MRNFSKQTIRSYYKCNENAGRTLTNDKNLGRGGLKDNEVRVGKYKYDTHDELGKGFSSFVYKGVEIGRIHKRYAIKVIDLKKFRGSNLEMLEAQIDIHKCLDHENIVKLHQVIKTSHHYYLILQYCAHGNLLEYIGQKKQLSETNSLEIMNQILAAYKYLLSKGIIHRDIKPANVLRVGNKWKISDFGFAVRSKFGFKDKMNVGTPLYMAPQSLKKNYYSCRSDFFSLGILMYEMIQGKTPWQVDNQKELIERMNCQIPMPKNIRYQKIGQFISKCCQINENKRFSKQQFEQFNIKISEYETAINKNSRSSSVSIFAGVDRKFSMTTDESLSKHIDNHSQQFNEQCSNMSLKKNPVNQQIQLLIEELSFIKMLYYVLKNIDSFHLESSNREMLMLTIFKWLLKLIRLLCDKNYNYLKINNWEEFRQCKLYCELYSSFNNYSEKYEKQYLEFIKHNDIKVIRAVNRKFPELCHNSPLTYKFYQNLKTFMSQILRDHNNEIFILFNQGTDNLNDCYEALQIIYFIYKLADHRSTADCFKNQGQKRQILIDYHQSKLGKNDYLNMRHLIKNI